MQIGFLLSLGLFVIAMAITRCVLSIGDTAAAALASSWAQREAVSTRRHQRLVRSFGRRLLTRENS
jgi:hypothetical protein